MLKIVGGTRGRLFGRNVRRVWAVVELGLLKFISHEEWALSTLKSGLPANVVTSTQSGITTLSCVRFSGALYFPAQLFD